MTTTSTLRVIAVLLVAAMAGACQGGPSPTASRLPAPASPVSTGATTSAPTTTAPLGLRMSSVRAQGSATLLPDGRVLVAGGYRGDGANDSTDVFDPSILSFRLSGKLVAGRYWHTATLLGDGRVVLIGGTGTGRSAVVVAEVWDPSTGISTKAGELPGPRTVHTATLLRDGRVLVVGGNDSDVEPIAQALLWDPATGRFMPAGRLAHPRAWHTAARLPDGRVLIAGGPAEAELWDPATVSFSPAGTLATPRWWSTSTALPDGRVIVIGGFEGQAFSGDAKVVATAEIWDAVTGSFRAAGSLAMGRALHAAVLLPDGRVVAIGGANSTGPDGPTPTTTVEIWDPSIRVSSPATIAFTESAALRVARQGEMATLLTSDMILVAGGANEHGTGIDSAELLGPFTP